MGRVAKPLEEAVQGSGCGKTMWMWTGLSGDHGGAAGSWLDLTTLKVFSSPNDSLTLCALISWQSTIIRMGLFSWCQKDGQGIIHSRSVMV